MIDACGFEPAPADADLRGTKIETWSKDVQVYTVASPSTECQRMAYSERSLIAEVRKEQVKRFALATNRNNKPVAKLHRR